MSPVPGTECRAQLDKAGLSLVSTVSNGAQAGAGLAQMIIRRGDGQI